MSIFTVGNGENYDKLLQDSTNEKPLQKLGRRFDYSGGFACRTAADAERLIEQQNREGEWAVYEVDAEWGKDTTPSEHGWWHALLKDSEIIKRVS